MAFGHLHNVKYAVKDGKLLLELDMKGPVALVAKSGNSIVATSNNWIELEDTPGWNLNLVLTKRPGAAVPADSADETMVERPKQMKA